MLGRLILLAGASFELSCKFIFQTLFLKKASHVDNPLSSCQAGAKKCFKNIYPISMTGKFNVAA